MFTATMSNHHPNGIIDVRGRLTEFLAYFHKLVAKHQNALPFPAGTSSRRIA